MFIPYTNENFVFTGIWQENGCGAVVNYKTAAFFEIGFTGKSITLDSNRDNIITAYIDGKEVSPHPYGTKYRFETEMGEHLLKVAIRFENHLNLKGIIIEENERVFAPPKRPYIHMIGDSITYDYPGFSTTLAESLEADYSIVAMGGMALHDSWGWYDIPEGLESRVGMESNYFKLEFPHESINFTDYKFDFCRQPDIITVFLGTNDFLDTEANRASGNLDIFVSHYTAFIAKLREIYPKSKIYIFDALTDHLFRRESIEKAFSKAEKIIDNLYFLDIQKFGIEISKDGIHPSLKGYNDLGLKLSEIFRKEFD